MKAKSAILWFVLVFSPLFVLNFPAQEGEGYSWSFTENFSTNNYIDSSNTTAWGWEERAGEICLPRNYPKFVAEPLIDYANNFAVIENLGRYAYFAEETTGVTQIVDLTDLRDPQMIKTLATNYTLDVVYHQEGFLYLTNYYLDLDFNFFSYFTIYDVLNDPINPTLIASIKTQSTMPDDMCFMGTIAVKGDWAYVLAYHVNSGLELISYDIMSINLTERTNPILESIYEIPISSSPGLNFGIDTFLAGSNLYLPDGYNGIYILDVSDPISLSISANFTIGTQPESVFVDYPYVFLCDPDQGLHVIDASTVTAPVSLTTYSTPQKPHSIWIETLEEREGYITYGDATTAGFQVLDLRNPANPLEIVTTALTGAHFQESLSIYKDHRAVYITGVELEIFSAGEYVSQAVAQSTTLASTQGSAYFEYVIPWRIDCVDPTGDSIEFYMSADGGEHWEAVEEGVQHNFAVEGFDLRWKAILRTDYTPLIMLGSPKIWEIIVEYHVLMYPPVLLNPLDAEMTFDNSPTLDWVVVSDADYYLIELDRSPAFNSPDYQIDFVLSPPYTVKNEGVGELGDMQELTPGTWYWRVQAVDYYGEVVLSAVRSLIVDNITQPADLIYTFGTTGHYVTWTPISATPAVFEVYRDGTWIAGEDWQGESITISVEGLPLGVHNYTCTVYEVSGDKVNDTVTVRVVPPSTILITSPILTTYTSALIPVTLEGDAEDFWYSIEMIDSTNQTWTDLEQRTLPDGSYVLHAYSNNSLGTITYANVTFSIDTTPPNITIVSPLSAEYPTNNVTISLTGGAVNMWYFVEDVDTQNHSWTGDINRTLAEGSYTLHAYGEDSVGNIAYKSVTFTVKISTTSSTTPSTPLSTTPTNPLPPSTTPSTTTTTTTSPAWSFVLASISIISILSRKKNRSNL